MKLTDMSIKKAKPKDKSYKLADGGGMYLQIEPSGGKLWRYSYRHVGKQKLLAIGKYPDVSLPEARKRHREAREQLANGVDPSAAKKAHKAAGKAAAANCFKVIALEWLDSWKTDKVVKHHNNTLSRLERFVFPFIGGHPITEISAAEVLTVLRRVEERAIPTAHRTRVIISQIMRFAVATGRAKYNPVADLQGALKPRPAARHFATITSPERVGELLRSIDTYRGGAPVRAALKIAPMVFVRPGELRLARWKDIDFDAAEWRYTVSKTKTEHLVPLSRQAMEILKDLEPLTGGGEFIFDGLRHGRPISHATIGRALQSLGYDTQTEITGHGFRAMARTMLAERLRIEPGIIEHQLAHKVPDALGTAYNRTKFIDDRRKMMQVWSDYLDNLKAGKQGDVVLFPVAV